jgi:hypothetical protein
MHRQDGNGKAVKQMVKAARRPDQNGVYSILNAPDDVHSRLRKMLAHAFSDRAVSFVSFLWDFHAFDLGIS